MSVNASHGSFVTPSLPSDPFLFSKHDTLQFDFELFSAGPWSSQSSSHCSLFFPDSPDTDQFCPSSAPTSPPPVVNLSWGNEVSPASIKQEPDYLSPHYHKEEPLIDCFDYFCPYLDSGLSSHCFFDARFDFPSVTIDPLTDQIDCAELFQLVTPETLPILNEKDLSVVIKEESFSLTPPAAIPPTTTTKRRQPKRKAAEMDSDETASTSRSESSTRKKPRQVKQQPQKKRTTKTAKPAVPKKSPDQSSSGYSDHLFNGNGPETSRRASPSLTMSTSTSNSDSESMSPGGTRKTARSLKDRSPEAYGRRREKNNIAVRKSREKKRQEIKKFADEHMKLRREVEQMRVQNEKLKVLVSEVEEGILDKSKTELAAMIHKVKKQMDW